METTLDSIPYQRCVGCLSTGRKLSLLTDKLGVEIYSILLDNLDIEKHNIPLCYECMGRVNKVVSFKQQVKKAHRYLKRYNENQAKSLSLLSLTRTEKYEWRPKTLPNQVPPNFVRQQVIRQRNMPNPAKIVNTKMIPKLHNTSPECVIVIPDLDEPDDKNQIKINTIDVGKNQPDFNPLSIETKPNDCDVLKIEEIQPNHEIKNIEKCPTDSDSLNIENDGKNLSEINSVHDAKNQADFHNLDVENQLDSNTIITSKSKSECHTATDAKNQSNFDTMENNSQNSTNCDVKVKNEESKSGVEIKIESVDDDTELQSFEDQTEMDYDSFDPVTKCEFSESDDELLIVKKVKKKEVTIRGKPKRGRPRKSGFISNTSVEKQLQELNIQPGHIERVILTWEEVEEERRKALTSKIYTRHQHRCENCVMGFNHQVTLEAHMKKHEPEAGDIECNVCKIRFKSESSLVCHKRRHTCRWRCCHCGVVYSRAAVAADHISRAHGAPSPTHACRLCPFTAKSLGKLRIHVKNHGERQHCEQCGKAFKDKYSLKKHLFVHSDRMDFSCEVCQKKFRLKHSLEKHMISHQASQSLYCVDCDMNFKNHHSYYQHLKYSLKHIHPDDLKFACEFCPSRFSRAKRLEEHRFSIHLKLAPHKCEEDGCTFASASRASLRTHNRLVHRNQRFIRNYVCHTCGKAFNCKKSLDCHIRSHTGERPYSCSICHTTFSAGAALYNHTKLLHREHFESQREARLQRINCKDVESDSILS